MSHVWKDPFLLEPQIFALTNFSITPLTVEQRRRLNLFSLCSETQAAIVEGMLISFAQQNAKVVQVDFSRKRCEGKL